jgi:hypothetical protein
MKTILALAYFFGSILIIFGLLWFGFFLAPPEFILDREAAAVEHGALKNSDRLFPNLKSIEPFHYPGALAGLAGQNDDCKVWLLVCTDKKQAKSIFESYAKKVTARFGIHQSSGPNYHNYKDPKAGIWGRIKRIDEVVLHVEAGNEETIDQTFKQSGLITPNPKANLLTDIYHTDKYFLPIVIFIIVYAAIQLPIWNRVGSWAVTVYPKPGVLPVGESELRQRLLAINDLDVPFKVTERKDGKLDVTWRLADAKWAGLMTMNKVTITQMIRLRLSEKDRACRAVDIIKSVRATADGLRMGFFLSFSFFRGIIFGQWEYEKQYGLIYKDGRLTFDTAYEYKFRHDELKNPIVNIVVQSGWEYKPVMFISKILGG